MMGRCVLHVCGDIFVYFPLFIIDHCVLYVCGDTYVSFSPLSRFLFSHIIRQHVLHVYEDTFVYFSPISFSLAFFVDMENLEA